MRESVKLQVKSSELRCYINGLMRNYEEKDKENLLEATDEYMQTEEQLRAALVAEESMVHHNETARREYKSLEEKVELGSYYRAIFQNRPLEGRERELNQELGLAENTVPWAAVQERADAVTPAGTTIGVKQQTIIQRVFARSATRFLGVSMPTVAAGDTLYPVITAGTSPAMVAADGTKEATAATIGTTTISPTRLQARYVFRREDTVRMAGLEDALRRDLRSAMREEMDKQVLTGNGDSPNVGGFLAAVAKGGLAAASASAVATFATFATALASGVDGKYAATEETVRMLLGVATYHFAAGLFQQRGEIAATQHVRNSGGGLMASAQIPAVAAKKQDGVLSRAAGGLEAVAPVWEGLTLIRDEVTKATEGQIAVTAVALWGFKIIRKDSFARLNFQISS